jgi:hypothetical protein
MTEDVTAYRKPVVDGKQFARLGRDDRCHFCGRSIPGMVESLDCSCGAEILILKERVDG